MIIPGQSLTDIGGGAIDFQRNADNNIEPITYSKEECLEQIKNNIINNAKFNTMFGYIGTGVYRIEGAFGRYLCVNQNHFQENDINITDFSASLTTEFIDKSKIPTTFTHDEFTHYTIFPLEEYYMTTSDMSDKMDAELAASGIEIER